MPKNEPIFFSTLNQESGPLIQSWQGTPAELFNNIRTQGGRASYKEGTDPMESQRRLAEYLKSDMGNQLSTVFRPAYPKFNTDEELTEFLKTFPGM